MAAGPAITVFGAYGHTGRFMMAELRARGFVPVASGRDARKLTMLAASEPGLHTRPASVDDPASLDRAVAGTAAVVNCAGPFATTAAPVIEAALRAGIPYVDVAAEIETNVDTFTHFTDRARAAGAVIVPAMAFFGGLGDLLTTTAMGDWTAADEAHIAYGLSGWHPTAGTRAAGAVSRRRRAGRRVRYTNGRLEYRDDDPPTLRWPFPSPTGPRTVIAEFTMADVVTVPSHLSVPEVRTYMTVEAARDIADPDTPAPTPVDERGRSAQTFLVDVLVRSGGAERRATRAVRTSTPSPRRSRSRRSTASSPDGPGPSASPPPARSSTPPTSSAHCPPTFAWNRARNGPAPASSSDGAGSRSGRSAVSGRGVRQVQGALLTGRVGGVQRADPAMAVLVQHVPIVGTGRKLCSAAVIRRCSSSAMAFL